MTIANSVKRYPPVARMEYSLREVFNLKLLDIPHLLVPYGIEGRWVPIQIGHLQFEQILRIPKIEETRWRYSHTTHEWIPIFHFVTDCESAPKLHEFLIGQVRTEYDSIREYFSEEETFLLTFKGHPFYIDKERTIELKEEDFR